MGENSNAQASLSFVNSVLSSNSRRFNYRRSVCASRCGRLTFMSAQPSKQVSSKEVPPTSSNVGEAIERERQELVSEQMYAYFGSTASRFQPKLGNALELGTRNFWVELVELFRFLKSIVGQDIPSKYTLPECLQLQLSNEGIMKRESDREAEMAAKGITIDAWPIVRFAYRAVCIALDIVYDGRPIPRFWVLETVARLPYQAYSSCLHFLSTLGWYRSPTLMNMHHAEDLNEAYHLAVMESLGGDQSWLDRFLAFHASLLYYWILVALFFISPKQSYAFSQLLESHAVDTYSEFVETNKEILETLPVPKVAHVYYNDFLFYFYEFQVTSESEDSNGGRRERPTLRSLYDVFKNILADELEHSTAMQSCVAFVTKGEPVQYNGRIVTGNARKVRLSKEKREEFWVKWKQLQQKRIERE